MILVIIENKNTKNEVTKICNEPGKNYINSLVQSMLILEIMVNGLKTSFFSKLSCSFGSSPFSNPGTTNATIANIHTWRTPPIWIFEGFSGILPVPVLKASPAKHTSISRAFTRTANSFIVHSFYSTLVTSSSIFMSDFSN